MDKLNKKILSDTLFTVLIFAVFSVISLAMVRFTDTYTLVPAVFTLGIYLVSYFTEGYVYGIVCSLCSMLENAVIHAVGMTKLSLNIYTKNEYAYFEVIDDGCGIHKSLIEDIFTGYFEKKEGSCDNQKHNMGIGLSVCASVIKAHDGELSVENLNEGGCCFRFSLKMEEEEVDW